MIVSRNQSLKMALFTGALLLAQPVNAMPVLSFDFAPTAVDFLPGGTIDFDLDGLFDDFTIISPVGGINGLMGEIDGTFTFSALGEVTSTSGTFEIENGPGDVLLGDLDFNTIEFNAPGPLQLITLTGSLDVDTPYTGLNTDLMMLAGYGNPFSVSVDFVYSGLTSVTNLGDLFSLGAGSGLPFGALGSVTALPEPRSLALLGLGIFSIGLYGRRWRRDQLRHAASALDRLSRKIADNSAYGTELTR